MSDSGHHTERSANRWGVVIPMLLCAYAAAAGVIVLVQTWNPIVVVSLGCLAFIAALVVTLIALVAMGFDLA